MEIIKINTNKDSGLNERAFRKYRMGINRTTNFAEPTVELDAKQSKTFDDFIDYCNRIKCCIYCNKNINIGGFKSNDDNEITASCNNCPNNMIDSSPETKKYVIWFNGVLKEFDMSFKDGFPARIKHVIIGHFCKKCGTPHTKAEYYNLK
jgi:hypothetical protein